jgi:hypothetical protein
MFLFNGWRRISWSYMEKVDIEQFIFTNSRQIFEEVISSIAVSLWFMVIKSWFYRISSNLIPYLITHFPIYSFILVISSEKTFY